MANRQKHICGKADLYKDTYDDNTNREFELENYNQGTTIGKLQKRAANEELQPKSCKKKLQKEKNIEDNR